MEASSHPLGLSGASRNTAPKQMFCRTAECKRECTRDSGVMAGHVGRSRASGPVPHPPAAQQLRPSCVELSLCDASQAQHWEASVRTRR